MNKNYLRGRRFEYEVKKRWTSDTHKALRTAGSHGEFDIVSYKRMDIKPETTREVKRGYEYITHVTPIVGYGIQCKVRKLRIKKGGNG